MVSRAPAQTLILYEKNEPEINGRTRSCGIRNIEEACGGPEEKPAREVLAKANHALAVAFTAQKHEKLGLFLAVTLDEKHDRRKPTLASAPAM
jgi:hypothetical protein